MANAVKPIKRSKELTPLSRDHHEGLLLVWKIRQGLKNGTEINIIAQYVQWFWQNHLKEHFREEEQILAPYLPSGNTLLQRMFDEHRELQILIHSDIADEMLLTQLADKLNDHIRFEERELFPFGEKVIPAEDLQKIGEQLSGRKKECPKWDNEFWLSK